MVLERTQLKFAISKESGELVGFVSRHHKSKKLMGVREDSYHGKKICLISEELKGIIKPDKLYAVQLKPMHNRSGYVVISAQLLLFTAQVETIIIPRKTYQVTVSFGNKVIYFDPLCGASPSSRTISRVIRLLRLREDIDNVEGVIDNLILQAQRLTEQMERDGYLLPLTTAEWPDQHKE